MNKTIAMYTAAAILAGFTIMMLPLALKTGPAFTDEMKAPQTLDNNLRELYGLPSKPVNLIPASLVFFAGLAAATGAYATLKKKAS